MKCLQNWNQFSPILRLNFFKVSDNFHYLQLYTFNFLLINKLLFISISIKMVTFVSHLISSHPLDNKPLYSDYMVWPFLEMTIPISIWLNHSTINSVDSLSSAYPLIGNYMKNMMENSIVQQVSPTYDTFKAYYTKVYGSKTN